MKKTIFIATLIFILAVSIYSLGVSDLSGSFRLNKTVDNGYDTIYNIEFVQSSTERNSVVYSVKTEKRGKSFDILFFEEDDEVYAIVQNGGFDGKYVVTESGDFHITLVNTDYPYDELKLVYDKAGNDFDYAEYYEYLSCLEDQDLKESLHDLVDNHIAVGYTAAREHIFEEIHNKDGYVEGVYTGLMIKTDSIPDPNVMNTEHTWPQSQFTSGESSTKKCDIHHLFPTDSKANSRRSSYHFGDVVDVEWEDGGSYLGDDSDGYRKFEPRDQHKGNVARALFYFSVRYGQSIPYWEEEVLRRWHKQDPVDEDEFYRNSMVEDIQDNRNPFVDKPEFVDQIEDF